ncbi:MAG: exopolyphosphatase, partial [Deltaproteobacteria bacterium]|nr:exopolyphosphatase [Deltaproteobacteria bacterium]
LLSFVMDSRTGLGRYRDYRISNLELMRDMIKYCRSKTVDEILKISDVQERVERYFKQERPYEEMLKVNCRVDGNVVIIDLRQLDEILSGNRFIEYALHPEQNVSVRAIWGRGRQNVVFTVGHSIFNRTCRTDIAELMFKYGGGGHKKVGTCQVDHDRADEIFSEIIATLKANG